MRAVLSSCLAVVLLLVGCGDASDPGAAPGDQVSGAPSIPSVDPDVDAAVRVAVEYLEAVRRHDAGAVYAVAWSGLRKAETRAEFVARTDFGDVSDARITGVVEVGWDARGRRMAIAPVLVTASGAPQVGRVLLVREDGEWRYFDLALPDQVPDLTAKRP